MVEFWLICYMDLYLNKHNYSDVIYDIYIYMYIYAYTYRKLYINNG